MRDGRTDRGSDRTTGLRLVPGEREGREVKAGMAISEFVEAEDVFAKVRERTLKGIQELLSETYAQDKEDFREDLAQILELEPSELPKVEVDVRLTMGKQVISVSGFEVEDTEDDE